MTTLRPKHPYDDARARRRYQEHDHVHVEFRGLGLTRVPGWLFDRDLEIIGLAFNEIEALPEEMELVAGSLRELDLRHNPISEMPSVIRTLQRLESLYICHTQIPVLPPWLAELPELRYVQVEGLELSALPEGARFRVWPETTGSAGR